MKLEEVCIVASIASMTALLSKSGRLTQPIAYNWAGRGDRRMNIRDPVLEMSRIIVMILAKLSDSFHTSNAFIIH